MKIKNNFSVKLLLINLFFVYCTGNISTISWFEVYYYQLIANFNYYNQYSKRTERWKNTKLLRQLQQ